MNGQPTAQNTRETGANGDLPGFRNWENPTHIDGLAGIWNVDPAVIPHWGPPTHALQIFRYCEIGSIRMLWIQATNPAVSLPNLGRVRSILQNPDLFIVVQDAFLTETTAFADVVLPAALWGEKTGTFTNADRTVHISHKAVEPPGEARADLDIFLDFARRMDFRDKDGAPLIKWAIPEEAFEAWKQCSRGRPCDYTGLSYAKLSAGSGICWPCNAHHPDGEPRPYKTLHFPTDHAECESYGHDLVTGGAISSEQYRARNPAGQAILKAAEYQSPAEEPDNAYPFLLTTGRLFITSIRARRRAARRNFATPRPMTSCRSQRKTPHSWGLRTAAGSASHRGGVRWKPGPGWARSRRANFSRRSISAIGTIPVGPVRRTRSRSTGGTRSASSHPSNMPR